MLIKKVNKAAKGHNRYCGPAAVSILTGCDTAEAARRLREVSGARAVRGTSPRWVLEVLQQFGVRVVREAFPALDREQTAKPWPWEFNPDVQSWRWRTQDDAFRSSSLWRKSQTRAKHGPTLAQWLKDTKADRTAGRVYLIAAGLHWQVISGRRYCCGLTGEIVSIKHKRVRRRARVTGVWELTKA